MRQHIIFEVDFFYESVRNVVSKKKTFYMVKVNDLPVNTFCLYKGVFYRKGLFQLALPHNRPLSIKQ